MSRVIAWPELRAEIRRPALTRRHATGSSLEAGADGLWDGWMELLTAGDGTYIRVVADGLDSLLVKVTRVSHHAGHVVCVLKTVEDVAGDWEVLGALSQLHALLVVLGVDALDPVVVLGGILNVLLEDDHVAVGDFLGGSRRQNWSCLLVDCLYLEGRRRRGQSRERGD